MKWLLLTLLAATFPHSVFADDAEYNVEFKILEDLGTIEKPHTRIDNAREALEFIMADKIVRKSVEDKMTQGYDGWSAQAKRLGYDGDEPVYEVRVNSSSRLPPYNCIYRFDSVGNDRRDQPWGNCKYE